MSRECWTPGLFSEVGRSLKRKLRFGFLMLSFEVLFLRVVLAGLRDVNFDVAGAALCGPWGAYFVAGTVLCGP